MHNDCLLGAWLVVLDGVPQAGRVPREAFTFYKFRPSEVHSDITISATPIAGWLSHILSKLLLTTTRISVSHSSGSDMTNNDK
jgi:hypothetical protein